MDSPEEKEERPKLSSASLEKLKTITIEDFVDEYIANDRKFAKTVYIDPKNASEEELRLRKEGSEAIQLNEALLNKFDIDLWTQQRAVGERINLKGAVYELVAPTLIHINPETHEQEALSLERWEKVQE